MTKLPDLGVKIGALEHGPMNAITDVDGVRVGHSTLIAGDGALQVGHGPVRTGVTVILPREGSPRDQPLFAGAFTLSGNGEFTGLEWIRESGLVTTPIALTNTHSVGVVRDAIVRHERHHLPSSALSWSMPAVAETFDGILNDIDGQHVKPEHVFAAIAAAANGPVAEGNIGGGTGMICHGFKGGIGTSSRRITSESGGWTVATLVQANYGRRRDLRVNGIPVGALIPTSEVPVPTPVDTRAPPGSGSIIAVTATNAPLLPEQCRQLAARAAIGLARAGGGTSLASGDIFLAFATGNREIPPEDYGTAAPVTFALEAVPHQKMAPLLEAAADSTEEAILNAILAAETMVGRDGITAYGLDPDRLLAAIRAVRH